MSAAVPSRFRNIVRRCLIGLGVLIGLLVVLVGGLAAWLSFADQRALAERVARQITGREVTVEGLRLTLGRQIGFELTGVRLPNAAWSDHPDMMRVTRLTGLVDAVSLLATPKFEQLRVEGYRMRLERGPERVGNWRFDGRPPAVTKDEPAPPARRDFPFLLDFAVADGHIVYRTTHGRELSIGLRNLTLQAADPDSPIRLAVDGSYNGKTVRLDGTFGSYRVLHEPEHPFPTALAGTVETGTLRLDGTMMRPIDFDGIDAMLHIDLHDLGRFIGLFGEPLDLPVPLKADTRFTHTAENWRLADLKGAIAAMPVSGNFVVEEGSAGSADAFDVQLAFDRLEIDRLLPKKRGGARPLAIAPPDKDASRLKAKVTARRVDFDGWQFADTSLTLTQSPERLSLDDLRFNLWRGQFNVLARTANTRRGPQFEVEMTASRIDAAAVLREFGIAGEVSGRLDAAATLSGSGTRWADMQATATGQAIVIMGGGRIASSLLEMASADLRALFRTKEGMTPITCFALPARLRGGVATVTPIQLRTPKGSFRGGGQITLSGGLDIAVGSVPASTGSLALDIPVHIRGTIDKPDIRPGGRRLQMAGAPARLSGMPGALAARNACAR